MFYLYTLQQQPITKSFVGIIFNVKNGIRRVSSNSRKFFKLAVSPHLALEHVKEVSVDMCCSKVLQINSK